jgi:DNA/RNA endonuclease G (NUC1)
MVPAIDIKDSCNTFIMSNVVPQIPCFNRMIWSRMEMYIRNTYYNYTIYTAPEFDYQNRIKNNRGKIIFIPIGFYKIIFDRAPLSLEDKASWLKKPGNNFIKSYYIKHDKNNCNKQLNQVIQINKLPYWLIK